MGETSSPHPGFEFIPEQILHFKTMLKSRLQRAQLRVLVVDDQLFTRTLLYRILDQHGKYTVFTAADAREGLTLYLENAPDIIFLDIELPDDNGHTLAHIIRELDDTAHVIMVSGNTDLTNINLAKKNKVHGFIGKPFTKQKVFESIEKYTAARKLRQEQGSRA
jgi:two-component system chemotaxis response regulator CheY